MANNPYCKPDIKERLITSFMFVCAVFTNLVKKANSKTLITPLMKISILVVIFQCFLEIFYKNKHMSIHPIKIDLNFTVSDELYTTAELIINPMFIKIYNIIDILNYTITFAIYLF